MSYGIIYGDHYYSVNKEIYDLMIELERDKKYDDVKNLLETSNSVNMLY